ncbi:MAG: hypothetical protein L0Y80_04830 [Ignavibacteriae bacterium]|nr:hypothetical protein [Ignavibacteriota bacterium]
MKKLEPREELEKKLRFHTRMYFINRVFKDYSHGISLIISLSIPTGLLLIPYLSTEQQVWFNKILLIVIFPRFCGHREKPLSWWQKEVRNGKSQETESV